MSSRQKKALVSPDLVREAGKAGNRIRWIKTARANALRIFTAVQSGTAEI